MGKTRTILIGAIAIGLLAGSVVGVMGQEADAEAAPLVEVTGTSPRPFPSSKA